MLDFSSWPDTRLRKGKRRPGYLEPNEVGSDGPDEPGHDVKAFMAFRRPWSLADRGCASVVTLARPWSRARGYACASVVARPWLRVRGRGCAFVLGLRACGAGDEPLNGIAKLGFGPVRASADKQSGGADRTGRIKLKTAPN